MDSHYFAVIMAGGGGTRLWPLSRQNRPKQMLSLFDERTLFQTSVERLAGVFDCGHVYVVTVEEQAAELQAECPDIPPQNFLIEPMPRGTASVVGLAAIALQQRDPQAVMAVLTSDHYIGNEDNFRQLLLSARAVAEAGHLVTLGITPSFASTGYGYIQRGEKIGVFNGQPAFRVLRFTEKPNSTQARQLLASGDHAWNSGMFVWKVESILQEFALQMPALSASLQEIGSTWKSTARQETIQKIWPGLKAETIDYGIMEGARQVAVLPATDLHWSDVGSWDSLFEVLPTDENGNIVMGGEHLGLDTKNSLIYLSQEHRLIVTIGLSDLVMVDTGDVVLICPKDQAQKVKQVVQHLKETNRNYV